MPNVGPGIIPGVPHAIPGVVGPGATFPQYGLQPSSGKIIIAHSNADKLRDIASGYVEWFPSQQAAKNAHAGQTGPLGSGGEGVLPNPLAGLAAVGDFFNRLTQANTWLRVGEVVAGLLVLYLGLNAAFRNTAGGQAVKRTTAHVKNAGKRALETAGAAAAA